MGAALLGGWYLWSTLKFARILRTPDDAESRKLARQLLKVSVMYLPALMLLLILDAHGRVFF